MPSVQTIALLMGTALALNLTPGPAILFIVSRCLGEGRAAAIVSVFGLATASIIHALAAGFGLSALLSYSSVAFSIIKYCGAAYLVYLGISGLMKGGVAGAIAGIGKPSRTALVKIYWQGFLTDLLNPKLLCSSSRSYRSLSTRCAVSRGNRCSYWACSFRSQEFRRTWRSRLLVAASPDGLPAVHPGLVSRTTVRAFS